MKPTKRFSRLMRDISSNAHENYYFLDVFIHLDANQL